MKNKFCKFVLSLLGMSSMIACDEIKNIIDPVCMYGTPYATFEIKGIVNDADGKPVAGIRVASKSNNYVESADTTNIKGEYNLKEFSGFPSDQQLNVSDVDVPDNGADYADRTVDVPFSNDDFKGGDGAWDSGTATKQVNIVVEKKTDE